VTPDETEDLARRIAEHLPNQDIALTAHLVDVATVARHLSTSEKFVRAHAKKLGGRRLIPGGPWRFDLAVARGDRRAEEKPSATKPPGRRTSAAQHRVPLLDVRGS
jgi:hypothetical protein